MNPATSSRVSSLSQAVEHFVKVLQRKGPMSLTDLCSVVGNAPEPAKDLIKKYFLKTEHFVLNQKNTFILNEQKGLVYLTEAHSSRSGNKSDISTSILNCQGCVQDIQQKTGYLMYGADSIVTAENLVYFDIMMCDFVDNNKKLSDVVKKGDVLYFNAELSPQGGSSKWRATRVWKGQTQEMLVKKIGNADTGSPGTSKHPKCSKPAEVKCASVMLKAEASVKITPSQQELRNLKKEAKTDAKRLIASSEKAIKGLNIGGKQDGKIECKAKADVGGGQKTNRSGKGRDTSDLQKGETGGKREEDVHVAEIMPQKGEEEMDRKGIGEVGRKKIRETGRKS